MWEYFTSSRATESRICEMGRGVARTGPRLLPASRAGFRRAWLVEAEGPDRVHPGRAPRGVDPERDADQRGDAECAGGRERREGRLPAGEAVDPLGHREAEEDPDHAARGADPHGIDMVLSKGRPASGA